MADLLSLTNKSQPPGIRFYPTEVELIMYYLKRKVMGKSHRPEMISEIDVYRFQPWDLASKSCLKTKDLNWYFFCQRSKKFPSGERVSRSTEYGYWKATGNDRTVKYRDRPVGKIKTLIYHQGKAPRGERTDWVIHEYKLEDELLAQKGVPQDSYVICKVYKKSGAGPKNGEHHGAPFVEEEWESDNDDGNVEMDGRGDTQNASVVTTDLHSPNITTIASTSSTIEQMTSDLHSPNVATVLTPSTEQQITNAVATQNVASTTISSVATQNVAPQLSLVESSLPAPIETGEELDRLLAMLSKDEALPKSAYLDNLFDDLEDLPDVGDSFLELSDLHY